MMTSHENDLVKEVARLKTEAVNLAQTLHTILCETEEAETCRIALSGLNGTETGRDYLTANPLAR